MIGKLRGIIDSYGDDHVLLDVQGVGYLVLASSRTLQALPRPGEAATLHIETYVREDQIRLFGFATLEEKAWFSLLLEVQGVGVRVALALLSSFRTAELASAIAARDAGALTRAPGVGKKLAERLVLDLKDKVPAIAAVDPALAQLAGVVDERAAPAPVKDALSALVNLGYPQAQAAAAVAAALRTAGEAPATATLIRLALRELAT